MSLGQEPLKAGSTLGRAELTSGAGGEAACLSLDHRSACVSSRRTGLIREGLS